MTLPAAIAILLAVAIGGWCVVAFMLGGRQDLRCAVTILLPVAVVFALSFRAMGGGGQSDAGWTTVFVIFSIVLSSFAALPGFFVWLLMERVLGSRAR